MRDQLEGQGQFESFKSGAKYKGGWLAGEKHGEGIE